MRTPEWVSDLPDLANRLVGGAVIWVNDEFFAECEALIRPGKPEFHPGQFGNKGQIYDGWETRRRRGATADGRPSDTEYDLVIIRLGMPGVIHGCVVDTAWFKGNYPPYIALDGIFIDEFQVGNMSTADIVQSNQWEELLSPQAITGDSENYLAVEKVSTQVYTHIRLRIFPDGGIARLRIHGKPLVHPRLAALPMINVAGLATGAMIVDCSNKFYSSPTNLIAPGMARTMGEGWETARRREPGNEWVKIALAGQASITYIEVDTRYFLGNCPGEVQITAINSDQSTVILPRARLNPDTCHRWILDVAFLAEILRVDIYPDGGLARLRVGGTFTEAGLAHIAESWPQ